MTRITQLTKIIKIITGVLKVAAAGLFFFGIYKLGWIAFMMVLYGPLGKK